MIVWYLSITSWEINLTYELFIIRAEYNNQNQCLFQCIYRADEIQSSENETLCAPVNALRLSYIHLYYIALYYTNTAWFTY